ncbi:MAG: DUF2779 domain-containing protein [Candidatus Heimdallarchaeota archaeon]|nr:DUF2779 domain-containing protein [Candidatus Heimdallarchaeota archaeon]
MKLHYSKQDKYPENFAETKFYDELTRGGFQVNELAKSYYPKGKEMPKESPEEAFIHTMEELENDRTILFEATILADSSLIRIDILIKNKNVIEIIEVKSKSVESIDERFYTLRGEKRILGEWLTYLADISFQTFTMEKQFPRYKIVPYLLMIDTTKSATVDGLNQMFEIIEDNNGKLVINFESSPENVGKSIMTKIPVVTDVKFVIEEVEFEGRKFPSLVSYLQKVLIQGNRPNTTVGPKCKNCEYRTEIVNKQGTNGFRECWKQILGWSADDLNKPHVFDIWNKRDVSKLLDQEIYHIQDVQIDNWSRTKIGERQIKQIEAIQAGDYTPKAEWIDPQLFEEMETWEFPLYFIDFETERVAIPYNLGKRPYEILAFQYSIHKIEQDGTVTHFDEWLNVKPGIFPNFEFVRNLKEDLSHDNGSIFCYSQYENSVLNEIYDQLEEEKNQIADYRDLQVWIRTITSWKEGKKRFKGDRVMIDMLKLVVDYYYHPLMGGSNGIKAVLPTIMQISDFLKEKYSKAYKNSLNYGQAHIWHVLDQQTGHPVDPFKLQAKTEEFGSDYPEITDGGEAMTIYSKYQFTSTTEETRKIFAIALKRYCELDTLAMVMIYEHWKSLK